MTDKRCGTCAKSNKKDCLDKLCNGPFEQYPGWVPMEKPTEYKRLRPISIKALKEAGGNRGEFRKGIADAILIGAKLFGNIMHDAQYGIGPVIKIASQIPGAIKFLLDHGFIKEVVPVPVFDPSKIDACETGDTVSIYYRGIPKNVICRITKDGIIFLDGFNGKLTGIATDENGIVVIR